MARKRGMGCVYKRGQIFWIKYSLRGHPYLESSHSDREADAKRLLKKRLGEIVDGRFIGPKADKVLLEELLEDMLNDYRINGKRSLVKAQRSARHLINFFGDTRAMEVTTDKVNRYKVGRQAEGISNAEINRELSALKRAFNLGVQGEKIYRKPHIPMLKEDNIRKGFFEPGEFLAVRNALSDNLKPVLTFGYYTGWRKEEILSLQWNQIDREAGTVRIDPGITKGGEGRIIFLEGELRDVIEGRWEKHRMDCPYVFHREGKPIRDFKKAWKKVLKETGLTGKLFHDLRRTAIRNMVRARVPERVAMTISGHKTRSVFERYNIVNEGDLREAAKLIEEQNRERMVTATVTVIPLQGKVNVRE